MSILPKKSLVNGFYFENENPPTYYQPENYQVNRKLLAYHPAMEDKILRDI